MNTKQKTVIGQRLQVIVAMAVYPQWAAQWVCFSEL